MTNIRKRLVRAGTVAAVAGTLALGLATSASAAESTCESWGGTCTSGSVSSNSNHTVCFEGKHKALAYWGRAELWDGNTGVMVGSFATNAYSMHSQCVGGLYGSNYYMRGTGGYFIGKVWN